MDQHEIDRLGATIATIAAGDGAANSPLLDAQRTFSDALSWERYCMSQSCPVTWEDMASAAHLMAQAIKL